MSMTDDAFDILVKRLEQEAVQHPKRYKLKVLGLAVLGYGYVFLILGLLLGLTALLVYGITFGHAWLLLKKLALPLILVIVVVLRAMWVRINAPTGIALRRADHPQLFAVLDDMRRTLKGPRFHAVLLTDDYNAAVCQVPRLGIFGWQKNYLILGLPLMEALSPEQFTAVLAHEYGHLAGSHNRFSCWIYRVRKTWGQINHAFAETGHAAQFIFRRFFNWYAPYFSAYSFVLARGNEYQADRCAAQIAGARNAADALLNVELKSFVHEQYWPTVNRRADHEPEPVGSAFTDLAATLRQPVAPEHSEQWLQRALARQTDTADTHPCLADRLKNLNEAPRLPPASMRTAAETFFGNQSSDLAKTLSASWRDDVAARWRERYDYVQQSLASLRTLDDKAANDTLEPDEAVDRILFIEEFRPADDVLPLARAALDRAPDNLRANYVAGRLLLAKQDDAGIPLIEKAMGRDVDYVKPGCKLIYNYLLDHDREAEATPYYDRYYARDAEEKEIAAERDDVTDADTFAPHGLPEETVKKFIEPLARYRRLRRGYLVRKIVSRSNEPLYVFSFEFAWWYMADLDTAKALQKKLSAELGFPGECLILGLVSERKKIRRKIKAVPGGCVYP